jgi:glycosyl hydrolase family 12/cellulose binding protein with CBM2 domain
MTPPRHALALAAAVALAAAGACVLPASSQAATSTLCSSQTASAGGGTYTIQNNEWGSSAPECITTDGGADFTVANSSIANSTSGAPGGYPSIYQGCHWGACSAGGLSASPVQASAITTGKVTTSWSTSQPGGSSDYDVAYDIWFNQTPTTSGQPNGAELMIWLNHNGPVQPFGSQVASGASIGGRGYNVWFGNQGWNTISYSMTAPTTSVSNLDLAPLVADAISRGYIQGSWYLIDVEAGFELWQGGAGLATNSFSVSLNGSGGGPTPTPTPTPTRSPSPSPSPAPTGGSGACSVAYSLVNSWPGGFQAQAVIKNTGSSAVNGWTLGWTFGGDQKISSLWNGNYTQSGQAVTVTNASYDATIPAGGTATVGFTATDTSNPSPAAFTLNGHACS